jgi:D-sedoheptulose 7-phosphate isomerase
MNYDPKITAEYLEEVRGVLKGLEGQLEDFVNDLYTTYLEGKTIFLIGNGGSAANASHFAQDLAKGTLPSIRVKKRFRAISLTDNVSYLTALANDEGYESIFVQQLINLARPGDRLIAISGSGDSPNILRAVEYANQLGMTALGVTGYEGGELRSLVNLMINVPSHKMGLVEAVHSIAFHLIHSQLCRILETKS